MMKFMNHRDSYFPTLKRNKATHTSILKKQSHIMMKSLFLFLSLIVPFTHTFSLTSKTTIKNRSTKELQTFLATPTNWPSIVLSSFGVEEADPSTPRSKINPVDRPLKKGERVKEIFGLPPILPLAVTWTCEKNEVKKGKKGGASGGSLEFFSADGLGGVAENCRMSFDIASANGGDDTTIEMTVEIDPVTPLANLAGPILKIDNDLALNVLLPVALKKVNGLA
jgi:hypothetical protein